MTDATKKTAKPRAKATRKKASPKKASPSKRPSNTPQCSIPVMNARVPSIGSMTQRPPRPSFPYRSPRA